MYFALYRTGERFDIPFPLEGKNMALFNNVLKEPDSKYLMTMIAFTII